jgi:hypothetical protein
MSKNEKIAIIIFLSLNSFISTIGMIYFISKKPIGIIGGLLPSYFFAVIAAYIVIFFIHPKKELFKRKLKMINWIMLILTILIATIVYHIMKK